MIQEVVAYPLPTLLKAKLFVPKTVFFYEKAILESVRFCELAVVAQY
jgi:hypothetical protein